MIIDIDRTSQSVIASVNGVALNAAGESVSPDEMRQRGVIELLRQAAQMADLLAVDDVPTVDGIISEAAEDAIDELLTQVLIVPEATEDDCRRYYEANPKEFTIGEMVHARHILFAVTDGVDVMALRKHAESVLLDVRCHDGSDANERFVDAAKINSNCPSSVNGGDLGLLTAEECASEFSRELFGREEIGVLPRLVLSRFGMHVVEVLERKPGMLQPYDSVKEAVATSLHQQAYITTLRKYLRSLADCALIENVDLETEANPLTH